MPSHNFFLLLSLFLCKMCSKAISLKAPQMVTLRANNFGFYGECSKLLLNWLFFVSSFWPEIKSYQNFLKVFLRLEKKCFYEVATSFLHDAFCKIAWQRVKNDPYTSSSSSSAGVFGSSAAEELLPTKSPNSICMMCPPFERTSTFIKLFEKYPIFAKSLQLFNLKPKIIILMLLYLGKLTSAINLHIFSFSSLFVVIQQSKNWIQKRTVKSCNSTQIHF